MKRKINKFSKIFSLCLTLMIASTIAYGGISYAKLRSDVKKNKNTYVEKNNDTTFATKAEITTVPTKSYVMKTEEATTKTPDDVYENTMPTYDVKNVSNIAKSRFVFGEEDVITWPVEGGVIMDYSAENTIWYKTLGLYKTNDGLVIGANVGEDIIASSSGVVTDVKESVSYGLIVTVDIGNGYEMLYGQVENSENLKPGMVVLEGEKIGTVAEPSRYFVAEGPNVFFKMTKDGVSVNPCDYVEE